MFFSACVVDLKWLVLKSLNAAQLLAAWLFYVCAQYTLMKWSLLQLIRQQPINYYLSQCKKNCDGCCCCWCNYEPLGTLRHQTPISSLYVQVHHRRYDLHYTQTHILFCLLLHWWSNGYKRTYELARNCRILHSSKWYQITLAIDIEEFVPAALPACR